MFKDHIFGIIIKIYIVKGIKVHIKKIKIIKKLYDFCQRHFGDASKSLSIFVKQNNFTSTNNYSFKKTF